ncbi:MAG TPA: glycolate oxidase subunit GlcE [Usitatibacter sp.]|jgi:glycolate oxidase FAD binding subunit|nr:glycolate oxidase subunit GlcE [Usitatibacter sp.]
MTDTFIPGLCARIADAAARKQPQRIRGGGTKDFYGAGSTGEVCDISSYAGIVAYEPRELVLTVRAGTRLAEVEAALAAERQMLPFEPPYFDGDATIGGTVAAGLSGPRRPYAGAVRDFVLGTRIVNGKGEDLSFGGRVIKNVAGYDVSRLMAGALGTLGVITEISFKVLPRPPVEATLAFEMSEPDAILNMNQWAGQPLPLSATAWQDGVLRVRLSGAESAVAAARQKLGGEEMPGAADYWRDLREQRLPFFAPGEPLWRISVAQTAQPIAFDRPQLLEWGGGVRWVSGELDALTVRSSAERCGGHATLFRGGDKSVGVFHPLKPAVAKIHRRLKAAFDPAGILNPGRMYDF